MELLVLCDISYQITAGSCWKDFRLRSGKGPKSVSALETVSLKKQDEQLNNYLRPKQVSKQIFKSFGYHAKYRP